MPWNPLKNKWGTDFNEPIRRHRRHKTTQGISSSSVCLRRAVTQFEIKHRLHRSEVRLSQVKADMDPAILRTHVLGSSKDLHFLAVHLSVIF